MTNGGTVDDGGDIALGARGRARLRTIAGILLAAETAGAGRRVYDQREYGGGARPPGTAEPGCGTACCVAGWLAVLRLEDENGGARARYDDARSGYETTGLMGMIAYPADEVVRMGANELGFPDAGPCNEPRPGGMGMGVTGPEPLRWLFRPEWPRAWFVRAGIVSEKPPAIVIDGTSYPKFGFLWATPGAGDAGKILGGMARDGAIWAPDLPRRREEDEPEQEETK